jgi:hypothetical protein
MRSTPGAAVRFLTFSSIFDLAEGSVSGASSSVAVIVVSVRPREEAAVIFFAQMQKTATLGELRLGGGAVVSVLSTDAHNSAGPLADTSS